MLPRAHTHTHINMFEIIMFIFNNNETEKKLFFCQKGQVEMEKKFQSLFLFWLKLHKMCVWDIRSQFNLMNTTEKKC